MTDCVLMSQFRLADSMKPATEDPPSQLTTLAAGQERMWVGIRVRPLHDSEKNRGEREVWTRRNDKTLEYKGEYWLSTIPITNYFPVSPPTPPRPPLPAIPSPRTPYPPKIFLLLDPDDDDPTISRSRRHKTLTGKPRPDTSAWAFDQVMGPEAESDLVYRQAAQGMVQSAMTGLHGSVFAYGQTGSGKTYTMRTIMDMAARDIFASIEASKGQEFLLYVSALEIYNEDVFDLLGERAESFTPLKLHEDPRRGTVVDGLHVEGVTSEAHLTRLLKSAEMLRHKRDTKLNVNSSRSHQIVQFHIESRPTGYTAPSLDSDDDDVSQSSLSEAGAVTSAVLNFIDLAGSERANRVALGDKHDGARLQEGTHINRSLLTLGSIIRGLAKGPGRSKHLPYRDSRLTRILQPYLQGNARSAVVCTVAPTEAMTDHTKSTVNFARTAKKIVLVPTVNRVEDKSALIRGLHTEIANLRQRLAAHESERNLIAMERDRRMATEEEMAHIQSGKMEVEKRLRNLERLILRGVPRTVAKSRAMTPRRGLTPRKIRRAGVHGSAMGSPVRSAPGSACGDDDGVNSDPFAGMAQSDLVGGAVCGGSDIDDDASVGNGPIPVSSPLVASRPKGHPRMFSKGTPGTRRQLLHQYGHGSTDVWFLDLFLEPRVRRRVDQLRESHESTQQQGRRRGSTTKQVSSTQERGIRASQISESEGDIDVDAEGVHKVRPLTKPLDASEQQALAALQAEVRVLRRQGSHPSDTSEVVVPSDVASTPDFILAMEAELQALEEGTDNVEDAGGAEARERAVASLRAEIVRAKMGVATEDTAHRALESLEAKITHLGFGSGKGRSPAVTVHPLTPDIDEHTHTNPLKSIFSPLGNSTVPPRHVPAAEEGEASASMSPLPDGSPIVPAGQLGVFGRLAHHDNLDSHVGTSMAMGSPVVPPAQPWAVDDNTLENVDPNVGYPSLAHHENRRSNSSKRNNDGATSTPNQEMAQQVWAMAEDYFQDQLATAQRDLRQSFERDVVSVRVAFANYQEQIARLNCQKRLLLQQVLKLEARLQATKEERREERRTARKATQQAESLTAQLEDAKATIQELRQAYMTEIRNHKAGSVASRVDRVGDTPRGNPWVTQEVAGSDESWAALPSEANLMPRILILWDQFAIPLIHRSRFILSLRGRETMYFEYEFRRLEGMKLRLDEAETRRGAEKALQKASRRLAEERQWLAGRFAHAVPRGGSRTHVYESFGVPTEGRDRKRMLTSRLWTREATPDYSTLWRHAEMVLRLYGEIPGEHVHETAFEAANVDPGKRSIFQRLLASVGVHVPVA